MLLRAAHLLHYLIWIQPGETLAGLALLCAAGVIAGAGVSVLARRRHSLRTRLSGVAVPALGLVLFCLADWALLRALPVLRFSFASHILAPLLASAIVRLGVYWGLLATSLLVRWRGRRRGQPVSTRALVVLFFAVNLAFSAVQVDAYVVEPLLVRTTELSLAFADLDPDAPPVRVVHLTDTHIERSSYREASVLQKVRALQPDIIVLTGDYLNLSRLDDPVSAEHFRQFVSQLHAPYGIYAVRGSVEPTPASMDRLVEGTGVIWLEQETVTVDVRGQQIALSGVACSHRPEVDAARLKQALDGIPDDAFSLLLYHSPDLIAQAAARHVDLYLSGHTHGGQLRLPFYGAIVTGSLLGKRSESGLYTYDDTTLYVSRGIGFEGGSMPRARFLCQPEIVSLELRPGTD